MQTCSSHYVSSYGFNPAELLLKWNLGYGPKVVNTQPPNL